MNNQIISSLTDQINRKNWWHTPPIDKFSYKKRGIFLASSYKECEFYGRPLNEPIEVRISKPLIDTEENVIKRIFGVNSPQMADYKMLSDNNIVIKDVLKKRFQLDADIYKAAKKIGYDSIVIFAPHDANKIEQGKLPRSAELNIFDTGNTNIEKNEKTKTRL